MSPAENPHSDVCRFCWLGQIDYMRAWRLQARLAETVAAGGPDILLLLEHPPTYTLGRRGGETNMVLPRQSLVRLGAEVVHSDRGGDITFHGPGQLVGYPIMNLARLSTGIRLYLRLLEETLIGALKTFGVSADRCESYTGVWVGPEKIAAIGVKVNAKRITQHGFALNVTTDLSYFRHIVPCGIQDRGVTALNRIVPDPGVATIDMLPAVTRSFGNVFSRKMLELDSDLLHRLEGSPDERF